MELEQKILAITKVIDNGGKTADRYTVYTPDGSIHYMSLNPNSPNGVNMYGGEFNNEFVDGEKLLFFPNEVQKAIIKNMKDDNSTNGYQKFVDLFQFYNLQPENVQWIIKNYTDMYGEDLSNKEIKRLLRELERIGYTFDYDMSGEMYGLRPIELELNDIQGYEDDEDDEDDDDEYEMGGNVGEEIWEESPQDILNELVQNMSGKNYKNFCYEYNIDNKDANEMIQFIYGLSDEDATEIIFDIEKNYESGGKIKNRSLNTIVRYSDGRKRRLDTWNRGRSWTMDRKSFNKNEDWEIPMNERKSKNTIKRQRVTRPIEKINSFMSGSPTELPQIKNDINPKLNEIIEQNPINLINNINTENMENKQDIQTNIGDNVGYARGSESEFYEGGGMMKSEKGKYYADGGNIFDEYEESLKKERMDAAISRMKDGISYKWVNTDMGSGWQLKLYFPNTSDVISDRLRVDLFEPYQEAEEWDELSNEDKKYYYNEWKNDLLEMELENFIQLNIDNENIDFFMEDDEEYSKGGNVKKRRVKDYKYVPNYMIESVTVAKGKKETEIDGGNILDGLYVKGRVNFEDGGDMEYEKGGSVNRDRKIVKYKDGRKRKLNTWNEGAGYTKDRKSFNKSEDWEIPMNERSGAKSSSRSSAKSSSKSYSKSKSTSKSGKGKSYSYIPNAMLREAEIENNGKRTYIDAKDILDGIYVKAGTKYADGGQASGGGVRRFDRQANMSGETRRKILEYTNYPIIYDDMDKYEKVKEALEKENFDQHSFSNYLYGLFDGYDYSDTNDFKQEMAKIKNADPEFHEKITEIYKEIKSYPENKYTNGGGVGKRKVYIGEVLGTYFVYFLERKKGQHYSAGQFNKFEWSLNKVKKWIKDEGYELVENPNKNESGGDIEGITLTSEQVENKLGRKLHWWNDDKVEYNGATYQKLFLKPIYKKI